MWRAVAAARLASLLYAAVSLLVLLDTYRRPRLALAVLAGMVVWSGALVALLARRRRRTLPLLVADLAVAVALLLAGLLVQDREDIDAGQPTLTLTLGAVPVVAWAVRSGPWGGGCAALVVCAATVAWRQDVDRPTVGSCVLLVMLGVVVGYVVSLGRRAERAYAVVVQREAAQAERERLARQVHDGVLQTLALVGRSGEGELAGLARSQERALRRLLIGQGADVPTGTLDLRALLPAAAGVELVAPAGPVALPAAAAHELAAAVSACLDNVRRHAGGRAFVLVEDEPGAVTVTVRDDGPGIAPGRLAAAEREGRLGVAQSIRGRLADLGGTVTVTSTPGQGTEVELHVPRG